MQKFSVSLLCWGSSGKKQLEKQITDPHFGGGSWGEHRINSTGDPSAELLVQGFSSSSKEKALQFMGIFVFGFDCGGFKRAAEQGSRGPDPLVLGGPSYCK